MDAPAETVQPLVDLIRGLKVSILDATAEAGVSGLELGLGV